MPPPVPTGERLALLFGHSLPDVAFLARGARVEQPARDGGPPVVAIDDGDMVFLRRHGVDRFTPAHLIDHQRHIEVLAELGCNRILALGSTGSLRLDWPPGTVLAPDDFFGLDATPTFFADVRGHRVPGFDEPWRQQVLHAWRGATSSTVHDGGTYAQTTGPRFESPAEVRFLAGHADVVGMTLVDELVLAGEAGMAYAAICNVDNLANGLGGHPLTLDEYRANKRVNEQRLAADLDLVLPALLASTDV
jgi:5'-methylthioadenosine phosphorylase